MIDPKSLDLRLQAISALIAHGEGSLAIELIEEITLKSVESSIDKTVFDDIKHSMFLASLFVICSLEIYHAIKEIWNARERLKSYVVKKELFANRLRKRRRVSDIGNLSTLPDLCLFKIANFL